MRTFFSNFTTQTIFAEKEHSLAKQYSDLVGTYTMRVKSLGKSSSRGGGSRSTNISEQARALISADEFKTLPFHKCVVTMTGKRPMFVNKIMYYKEKELKDKVKEKPCAVPDLLVKEPELLVSPTAEKNNNAITPTQTVATTETKKSEPSMAIRQWGCETMVQSGFFDEIKAVSNVVRSFIGDRRTVAFLG